MITPCDCDPIPARSHLESKPGAQHVHLTDNDGVWHAIQIGEAAHKLVLLTPSEAYLDGLQDPPDPRVERRAQLKELALRRGLTMAEIQEALGLLL